MNASKKSKKNSPASPNPAEAPEVASPVSAIETPEAPEVAPEPDAKAKAILGAKSPLGFSTVSRAGYIESALVAGDRTRPEIFASLRAIYAPGKGDDTAEVKGLKTTLSVFLGDLKRPFGTYHASRSIRVEKAEDGKLRANSEDYARAASAIASGLFGKLKEAKTATARKTVLSSFGLPTE